MAAKKNNVNRELVNKRVAFVKANPNLSPAEARKRFFVQTRAKELQAAGKEVNRAALRKQFETGKVKRQEFYTAADKKRFAGSGSSGGSKTDTTISGTVSSTPKYTSADQARKSVPQLRMNAGGSSAYRAPTGRTSNMNQSNLTGFRATAESLQASYVNPLINSVGRTFGQNPNFREAGRMEKAKNTLGFVGVPMVAKAAKPLVSATIGRLLRSRASSGQLAIGPGPRALGPGPRALGPGPRPMPPAPKAGPRAGGGGSRGSTRR